MKRQFYFVLYLLVLLSINVNAQVNVPEYVPANGLVGWWPFNGNAADKSGNNNNGSVINAVLTTDRFGNAGAAYMFNGVDSRIDVADAASLRVRKLTISVWVKLTSLDSTATVANQMVYKGSMTAEGEAYGFNLGHNGEPACGIKIGSNCTPAVGWQGTGVGLPTALDNWVNLVTTFDGQAAKLYRNGVLETSNAVQGLIDSCAGGGLRFGFDHLRYFASTGDPFHGMIDDIGIWNRALDSTEIQGLFAGAADCGNGKLGINVCAPKRSLHIKDVLRLEPRNTEPENPEKGDIYFDGILNKLRVYDGTVWQNCW